MNNSNVALVVIDMQVDFLTPSSPLYVAGGPAIAPAVHAVVERARSANVKIVHATRQHRPTGVDIDLSRLDLFTRSGPFLVAGTTGAQEISLLEPAATDLTVIKTRWSAFFGTNLDLLLRRLGVHHVVLAGVQTPNCIRATAVDALSLDYATTVLSDATASQTEAIQASNLADMAAMGIQILTVTQFEESLVN
ncbi:MAG: cysteine hydrolase family protein [Candidatus Cryosericum sp.]